MHASVTTAHFFGSLKAAPRAGGARSARGRLDSPHATRSLHAQVLGRAAHGGAAPVGPCVRACGAAVARRGRPSRHRHRRRLLGLALGRKGRRRACAACGCTSVESGPVARPGRTLRRTLSRPLRRHDGARTRRLGSAAGDRGDYGTRTWRRHARRCGESAHDRNDVAFATVARSARGLVHARPAHERLPSSAQALAVAAQRSAVPSLALRPAAVGLSRVVQLTRNSFQRLPVPFVNRIRTVP